MTDYWPTAERDPSATPAMLEFARIWRDKPKVVFSRTLQTVDWNSRLVRDDPAEEVARLKAQPGFDVSVGGPTLASTLMRHRLIDEYRLYVNPVVLGAGKRFFPELEDRVGLKLLETRTFGSGVVYLRYGAVGAKPYPRSPLTIAAIPKAAISNPEPAVIHLRTAAVTRVRSRETANVRTIHQAIEPTNTPATSPTTPSPPWPTTPKPTNSAANDRIVIGFASVSARIER
jgi:dihydrofolate reductase